MKSVTLAEAVQTVEKENHITLVFENGFEEEGKTAKEFENEIFGEKSFEENCEDALLGKEYRYQTFLSNSHFEKNAVLDIVKYGEWSYILLHDQVHPIDEKLYVAIENKQREE